jgi:hypothetical protein
MEGFEHERYLVPTSSDGVTWSDKAKVPGASTSSAPSLSVGTGSVVLAYRGTNDLVNVIAFPTGIDPGFSSLGFPLDAKTDHAPALTATGWVGNGLIVLWTGKDDKKLRYAATGVSIGGRGVTEPRRVVGLPPH